MDPSHQLYWWLATRPAETEKSAYCLPEFRAQLCPTGIIGIVAPILKLVVEALFRSRYPDMDLPSSFAAIRLFAWLQ